MGRDTLAKLLKQSNFPWLLSNVTDYITSMPLLDSKTKVVIKAGEIKVGFIRLIKVKV